MCFSGGTVSITGNNSVVFGLMHLENGAKLTIYEGAFTYNVSQYMAEGREVQERNLGGVTLYRVMKT